MHVSIAIASRLLSYFSFFFFTILFTSPSKLHPVAADHSRVVEYSSHGDSSSRDIPNLQDLVPLEAWSKRVNYRFTATEAMLQRAHMNGNVDSRLRHVAWKLLQGKPVKVRTSTWWDSSMRASSARGP